MNSINETEVGCQRFLLLAVSALIVSFAADGYAQSATDQFPNRPVTIVVPYAAGGGVDALARPIAERLSKLWKQPVIVENRGGAAAVLGTEHVVRSAPDGATLLFTTDGPITTVRFMRKKLPFDPIDDLVPISQIIDLHQMILVNRSIPAKTLAELVEIGKKWPGGMNYGSQGVSSTPHLLFEMLKHKTGMPLVNVQYKGLGPVLNDLIAGTLQLGLAGISAAGGHIKAGTISALATSRPTRAKELPNVPTLAEVGFGDIHPQPWLGVFAPKGTPDAIVNKIQADIAKVLAEPDFLEQHVESVGFTAVGNTPGEFKARIVSDTEQRKKILALMGLLSN